MYIEGNALILGDSSYLEHHGILGQKWGVRRFQNKDGTRTAAGKAREDRRVLKKGSMVYRVHAAPKDYVYDNKKYVSTNIEDHNKWADYFGNEYAIRWKPVYYQRYKTKKDLYVATGKDIVDVVSTKLDKQMVKRDLDSLEKEVKLRGYDWDNTSKEDHYSMLLGAQKESGKQIVHELQKMGFGAIEDDHGKNVAKDPVIVLDPDKKLRRYGKTAKDTRYLESYRKAFNEFFATHTSIGGTMYIEGNALILGDSSYLEHHGIRGQRWGVRRFQNRDGSLTNAGRKRLGYATKGVTQTVGKAFKAGVKAGGSAVKAVKAHHEKKEAEKLEKKKEKASKTRLGVMANKDLFTNEEIRKLNERFKLEDEMKMATLQKGVEIAKAVGTIAQNVGTVAKTYEDVTGQSLSPIKRKAAEEKARQDKEDRDRRIAREDADEARKAAKEERDIAIHEQTLRKAIAAADTQEFTAQKTKAEADSSVLDAIKKGQDFNGGSDATGQSWVENATSGGKNVFEQMKYDSDPEYRAAKDAHDEKVARKERMAELDRREKERQAEKEAASKQSEPQQKQGSGDDDALFSQKGSLPIDKDRYKNNRAMEKAKKVKEDAAEERAKKQDEKAVDQTIDDTIEANRSFKETVRAQDPHAYDRGVAKDYIKGKFNNLPNALADLNPINRAAKKIADKATKEEEAQVRKNMKDQYDQMVKSDGRDEANYVMYQTRVANLQQQGYSERKAKQIADSNPTFSAKRNRKVEYSQKVKDLDATHRKNSKEIDKANKELTDYYYKLVNGPGYDPGTPKREALDRKYKQKRGELERLEKDNNEMLEKGMKDAKKILEHSLTIQNGVLFVDSSDGLTHHGIRGQRWGVRRFQNADGSLTPAGKKRDARSYTKTLNKNDKDMAWQVRYRSDNEHDANHWKQKAERAKSKGKYEKAEKYLQKSKDAESKAKDHTKNIKNLEKENARLISEAMKKGYDVKGKDVRRKVDTGKEIAANIVLRMGATAAGLPLTVQSHTYVAGTKYKVKNPKPDKPTKAKNKTIVPTGSADKTTFTNTRIRGNAYRVKRAKRWKERWAAKHSDDFRSAIQDGTLFINSGEPHLEHHGVRGMKWGKHLMAGKGVEGGGGGGFAEDDEKLKEMAKKAGMSVAEFRTKMAGKLSGAAAKAKKEIGYAYGSEYKKDFEKAARLHENNSKSMHAQAKSAWEGYGKSRTAAQKDNWKRYAEYDRQAEASGNMFVKRERSKQAYDNSLASKVDSVKRKARLTQDKAKSKISDAVDVAKKTRDDVKDNIRSKTGIGVKKDIERNARLAEGQKRRSHELTKQVYSAKGKEDWARAYSESNKESFKAWDNEAKVKKDTKSYPKSIAGRVDSAKRKARLTKDSLKSALSKSKQRKQLTTEGPKAKKQISNAKNSVEKAARSNEAAYRHAKEVYRQTGGDSDAYKQAIKRSRTTLQRSLESQKRLKQKKRAKHSDDTNAIYTEGTRLVVNSKWG